MFLNFLFLKFISNCYICFYNILKTLSCTQINFCNINTFLTLKCKTLVTLVILVSVIAPINQQKHFNIWGKTFGMQAIMLFTDAIRDREVKNNVG